MCIYLYLMYGLPRWCWEFSGGSWWPACRRPSFDPWVGKLPWRRKWQPTQVFLPGESQGQRSLVGYSPWGHKASDTSEWLHFTSSAGTSGKELTCQCKRHERQVWSWVWEGPLEKEKDPTPVFLPRESPGQRTLAGYCPKGSKESDMPDMT